MISVEFVGQLGNFPVSQSICPSCVLTLLSLVPCVYRGLVYRGKFDGGSNSCSTVVTTFHANKVFQVYSLYGMCFDMFLFVCM